jgi:aminopeptidase C
MTRKEKKEKADKKRLEITNNLHQYLTTMYGTALGEPPEKWNIALKKADEWVSSRIRLFPQDAHMYRSAAVILKNIIKEAFKKGGA